MLCGRGLRLAGHGNDVRRRPRPGRRGGCCPADGLARRCRLPCLRQRNAPRARRGVHSAHRGPDHHGAPAYRAPRFLRGEYEGRFPAFPVGPPSPPRDLVSRQSALRLLGPGRRPTYVERAHRPYLGEKIFIPNGSGLLRPCHRPVDEWAGVSAVMHCEDSLMLLLGGVPGGCDPPGAPFLLVRCDLTGELRDSFLLIRPDRRSIRRKGSSAVCGCRRNQIRYFSVNCQV